MAIVALLLAVVAFIAVLVVSHQIRELEARRSRDERRVRQLEDRVHTLRQRVDEELPSQLADLRRRADDLEEWGRDAYAWLQTQAAGARAVAEPTEPVAPERVAPEREEPVVPTEPEVAVEPELVAPTSKPRVPPRRREVSIPRKPVVRRPEEPVAPAEPRVPPTPEPVAPELDVPAVPAKPAEPPVPEPAPPKPEERVPPVEPRVPVTPEAVVAEPEAPAAPAKPEEPPVPKPAPPTPEERVPPAKPRVPVAPVPVAARRDVPAVKPVVAGPPPVPWWRRVDIEVLIGTGWLTRIGMVAVLLAAAFFLKYAWDKGWIEPWMLVCIGILAGIGMITGGELTDRRGYGIQSQVLTGGGAAVMYLTLWAGFSLYGLLSTSVTFAAMAIVTVAAACQAVRHESETVATFAWIAGYAVPLLIRASSGGGSAAVSSGPGILFAYLVLLSIAVFFVAQRYAWPMFTGLALLGAFSSGTYIFRQSAGALGWTLTYLMIVTAGMLWVATSRKGRAGERFGAIGAIAGYLVTGAAILEPSSKGSPYVPYMYLLVLSGAGLWISHVQGWRVLRWCGALGSFVGFVLLFVLLLRPGAPAHLGHWLLLYVVMSVVGAIAISAGRHPDAEPLAVTVVTAAYGAAALLAWASRPGAVSDWAMFAYLGVLAAAVLMVSGRFAWPVFSRVGFVAAFLATILLYEKLPHGGISLFPLLYLTMLGAAALQVTAQLEDRILGGIGITGIFLALPLTGSVWPGATEAAPPIYDIAVPAYLALAAVGTLAVIELAGSRARPSWYGLEWISLAGTWVLYLAWRAISGNENPDAANLRFTTVYFLAFLAAMWVRHGLRDAEAGAHNAVLAVANVAIYFALGFHDLGDSLAASRGWLALALSVLHLAAGIAAVRRRPAETYFGPVLIGIGIVFLTLAIPFIVPGYSCTVLWALEATVLLGLGFYYQSPVLRAGALTVLILPLFRAIAVDSRIAADTYWTLLESRGLSFLAVIAAMYIGAYWYARHADRASSDEGWLRAALGGAATVLLLWLVSIESWTYVGWQLGLSTAAQHFALSATWIVFAGVLIAVGTARDVVALRWSALGLLAAATVKVFALDPGATDATYRLILNAHAAPLLAIVALLYVLGAWRAARRDDETERATGIAEVSAATCLLLWIVSIEVWRYVGWQLELSKAAQHFALSATWIVFAGVLIAVGTTRDVIALRWSALGLLAATTVKVFALDPAVTDASYRLILNAHAAPLLTIVGLLYALGAWRVARRDDEIERATGIAEVGGATGLLLWVVSVETWRYVGWERGLEVDVRHFALSGAWILFGAILMALGTRRDVGALRWAAIGLFAATVTKVLSFDPSLVRDAYSPLINAKAAPLLAVAGILYAAGAWYFRAKRDDEIERPTGAGVVAAATVLLLWVASWETWRVFGWTLDLDNPAQHFALSAVWIVFAAAFLALGTGRDVASLRWASLGLLLLTTMKVFYFDWRFVLQDYVPLVNAHTAPLLAVTGLLYAAGAWYRRTRYDESERGTGTTLLVAATGLLMWIASAEAWFFFPWWLDAGRLWQHMALSMVWLIFAAVMLLLGTARRSAALRWVGLVAVALIAAKVLTLDHANLRLPESAYYLLVNPHAFPLIIVAGILFLVSRWYRRNPDDASPEEGALGRAMPVLAGILLWWVFTWEAWYFVDETLRMARGAQWYALSAVWTVYGAILIAMGIVFRNAAIRWTAMALLAITIVKVFILDMSGLQPVFRILALVGLGLALIAVGFGYQRLVREHTEP